jgi:hypothetical protein
MGNCLSRLPDIKPADGGIDISEFEDIKPADGGIDISEFQALVEAYCVKQLALDDSRRQFVRDQAVTIYQLLAGTLKNCSRFRRCLLGRKSVGKTMLLWTLCSALKELCPRLPGYSKDGLEVIFLSCEQQTDRTLRCAVALALKLDGGSSWDTVVEFMRDNNKKVLLVIDELQLVYNSDLFNNGIEFIKDIARIGGDNEGLFHCLLSGSSSDLRRLLSAKMSMEEAKEKNLGNYAKVDLNGTKFQACTLTPFLREEHLSKLVDHLAQKHHKTERYNLDRVFMETAGFPGVLDEYIRNWPNNTPGDNYATGLRSLAEDTVEFKLLAQLFSAVRELKSMRSLSPSTLHTPEGDADSVEFTWTTLISVDHIDRNVQQSVLYNLADSGYLQYLDREVDKRIGFYSPRIYLEMSMRCNPGDLTLAELMALRCPQGVYEKAAEEVTARVLMRAVKLWREVMGVPGTLPVAGGSCLFFDPAAAAAALCIQVSALWSWIRWRV